VALAKEVIVISGCSGRVGSRVAHKFADPRFQVIGLDIVSPKISTTNFEFISCDCTSGEQVKNAMQRIRQKYGERIASIVHLATSFNSSGGNYQIYDTASVKGAENLIQAASGFQTEQFLFGSSLLVYVPCEPGQRITEHWPVGSSWEFPRSKLLAEDILKKSRGKIPLVIMRSASTYDTWCHSMPLAHQIQRIYERLSTSFFYPGNLTHGSALVHLDDVADAIWLAVQRRFGLPPELTLILAEPETVSYGELQRVIGLLCYGEECKTWSIPKWVAKLVIRISEKTPFFSKIDVKEWMIDQADHNYCCDISLIQDKLGWAPKHTFRQTLPKMITTLKENPLTWYRENSLTLPETRTT
jgi:nucleoside-diphosphate-sugar epimerase